ncbi:MAG: hypothetical protein EKK46_15160 [Rhodocyclaceae bacterium]|nr:MAG: hypothetical protein EKK46_15160 [Rhodocyclaceae bacterium]
MASGLERRLLQLERKAFGDPAYNQIDSIVVVPYDLSPGGEAEYLLMQGVSPGDMIIDYEIGERNVFQA